MKIINFKIVLIIILILLIFLSVSSASNVTSNDNTSYINNTISTKMIDSSKNEGKIMNTNIHLNDINNTYYNDDINISGYVNDKSGKFLKSMPLNIDVNDKKYESKTNKNGNFYLNIKGNTVGKNNISISFNGNNKYNASSYNSSFLVIPKNTLLIVNNISSCEYTDLIKISGRYTDIDGYRLRLTPLTLNYNNIKQIKSTDDNGYFTFNIKSSKLGKNIVHISYPGNSKYSGATISKEFNVTAKSTILQTDTIHNIEYSDYAIISGKYTDTNNNSLRYTPINLNINGLNYSTYTNKDGFFTYKYKCQKIGVNKIILSFKGNLHYKTTSKTMKFNVTRKSIKILVSNSIKNNQLIINGRFTDTNNVNIRYTPLVLRVSYKNIYTDNQNYITTRVTTDTNGYYKYKYNLQDYGTYTTKVSYYGNSRFMANNSETKSIIKGESHVFVNSLQGLVNQKKTLNVNVTDKLNNSIKTGKLSLYVNNQLVDTANVNSNTNTLTIPAKSVGVYTLKVVYSSDYYNTSTKTVLYSANPKSDYKVRLIWNPAITHNLLSKISGYIRNNNKKTVNTGVSKFYFNNNYVGSQNVKNNLSKVRFNITYKAGDYPVRVDYYVNNKFIASDADIVHVRSPEKQVAQNTYVSLASDLVSNSVTPSSKKDVYFAMDRTTVATYNYSPNDMKIMYNIASNLRVNGFNVKTIRNGPGETYKTAKYMYNHNVRNSICFILCNGVDANVIRQYLKGNDGYLTAVRNRGNDIVMGWFYGAGNFYDKDSEYYYYLEKAWDDNYSGKGGLKNPRSTMERDGIKVIYERCDLTGRDVADSFVKLYKGKVTSNVNKKSTLNIKSLIYKTDSGKVNGGRLVYTLNNKVIKNVTVTGNVHSFKFTIPNVAGTYNLMVTYYYNNKLICQSYDKTLNVL